MIKFLLSSLPYTASRKAYQRCCKQSLIIMPEIAHYNYTVLCWSNKARQNQQIIINYSKRRPIKTQTTTTIKIISKRHIRAQSADPINKRKS